MSATDRRDERLVTIAVFESVVEASLARGALEADGIRALVPEEPSVRLRGTYFFPAGRLQVLDSDRERAMIELRRCQIRIVEPE